MTTPAAARAGALARAVPMWAWLTALVLVSAAIRFALARRMPAPWIMVDELIYSELAKSFAADGRFLIRDVPAGGAYGVVYPLLISPARPREFVEALRTALIKHPELDTELKIDN